MDAIEAACRRTQASWNEPTSNRFFANGNLYFYEVTRRDQRDLGVAGAIYLCLPDNYARKVGTFRIDGKGRVVRGPKLFRTAHVKRETFFLNLPDRSQVQLLVNLMAGAAVLWMHRTGRGRRPLLLRNLTGEVADRARDVLDGAMPPAVFLLDWLPEHVPEVAAWTAVPPLVCGKWHAFATCCGRGCSYRL
jgi:hypothetical protein